MESSRRKSFSTVIYRLIFAVVRLMSFIPFRTGQFLGRLFGRAFAMVPMGRTRVSLDNLLIAFGDHMEAGEIKRLNRRVVMHFGEMLFELPHILRLNHANLDRYVVLENKENLLNAMEKGKGIFILTAHFGNWELMSVVINLCFAADGAVVARPVDFSPADRVISNLRSRFGAEIISKDRGMRKIIKAVRNNRAVGILLDQNVDWYSGVFVEFLGRQACVNKGLALMALRNDTPVVPAFSVRQPDGRYRIIFEKEVDLKRTGDRTKDIEENTAIFTGIIEKYIRQYPDHWFWFHKRWKTMFYCPLPNDYFEELESVAP
jgi:KDO2-lipid IV(A) lauroyltransferase